MPNKKPDQNKDQNEGEGSKTAAAEYNKNATAYARSGKAEFEAEDAVTALKSEAEELQRAEDEGRRHIAEEDPEVRRPTKK